MSGPDTCKNSGLFPVPRGGMPETSMDRDLGLFRHEIANALMTVRGYAELMLMRESLDIQSRRYSEKILRAVDNANRALEQLYPTAGNTSLMPPAPNGPKSEKSTGLVSPTTHQQAV